MKLNAPRIVGMTDIASDGTKVEFRLQLSDGKRCDATLTAADLGKMFESLIAHLQAAGVDLPPAPPSAADALPIQSRAIGLGRSPDGKVDTMLVDLGMLQMAFQVQVRGQARPT